MDILSARNELLEYFLSNPLLKLKDYNKTFLLVEDIDLNREIVKLAAEELVKNNIINHFIFNNEDYYVLHKPIESYQQNITLSSQTCLTISKIINDYCQNNEDKENLCDPLNIEDKDIQNILKLLLTLNNQEETFEDEDDE